MIKLYYHIYTSTHHVMSLMFIDQQLRRIKNSRIHEFADFNVFIHGPFCHDAAELVTRSRLGAKIKSCETMDIGKLGEFKTLRYIYEHTEPTDTILYMHTKGIGYICGEKTINGMTLSRNLRAITSWRWAMEYYLLDRWVERVNCFTLDPKLKAQGILLHMTPYWNFLGNFWWTKGDHIRLLPHPDEFLDVMKPKDIARAFIMSNMPRNYNLFTLFDAPREDAHLGFTDLGTFRLHEDDCMPYVLKHRKEIFHPPIGPEHLINE